MTPYSTDHDLVDQRPDILDLGQGDWTHMHEKAKVHIDRDIKIKWYRKAANDMSGNFFRDFVLRINPFFRIDLYNPDLLLTPEQLKDLSTYKTLQLIYQSREKETQNDPFAVQTEIWRKRYNDELIAVIASGIDYDWNQDGNISRTEKNVRVSKTNTLVRM